MVLLPVWLERTVQLELQLRLTVPLEATPKQSPPLLSALMWLLLSTISETATSKPVLIASTVPLEARLLPTVEMGSPVQAPLLQRVEIVPTVLLPSTVLIQLSSPARRLASSVWLAPLSLTDVLRARR